MKIVIIDSQPNTRDITLKWNYSAKINLKLTVDVSAKKVQVNYVTGYFYRKDVSWWCFCGRVLGFWVNLKLWSKFWIYE